MLGFGARVSLGTLTMNPDKGLQPGQLDEALVAAVTTWCRGLPELWQALNPEPGPLVGLATNLWLTWPTWPLPVGRCTQVHTLLNLLCAAALPEP